MKLLVYSHDAFGLGNIRRMLAICQHLLQTIPSLSILVLSGSPALHSLRLPRGLDYIKLPCVSRCKEGKLGVRFLDTPLEDTMQLRSQLIQTVIANFQPDLFLVDKKPVGLEGELMPSLYDLKVNHPECKLVLMLRDILDTPEETIDQWQKNNYYNIIDKYYDQVWVAGTSDIFDIRQEYQFPISVAEKVRFCGYIRRGIDLIPQAQVRQDLGISPHHKMVLITAGGGGDGEQLLHTYLQGLINNQTVIQDLSVRHVIVCGPEMPTEKRQLLYQTASSYPQVQMLEFTPNLDSYMNAADVVVSMGGYNTVCEILSLGKRAIIVPRQQPVQEQLLRVERMATLNVFRWIHPDKLTSEDLIQALVDELEEKTPHLDRCQSVDLNALPRISQYFRQLLDQDQAQKWKTRFSWRLSTLPPQSCEQMIVA